MSTAVIAEIYFFSSAYSAQTVRPLPKLTHERHILGKSTSPRNNSHCPKLCHLSCTPITNTFRKYHFQLFLRFVKPLRRNAEIFNGLHMRTPIYVLYCKNSQNRFRISNRKSALYWWQKKNKTRFGILGWNPWGDFPYFVWLCTFTSHLYSRFHPDPFRFGGI